MAREMAEVVHDNWRIQQMSQVSVIECLYVVVYQISILVDGVGTGVVPGGGGISVVGEKKRCRGRPRKDQSLAGTEGNGELI